MLVGQTMEIAVFRALQTQTTLDFLGNYPDLNEHDDSTLYRKEEPRPLSADAKFQVGKNSISLFTIATLVTLASKLRMSASGFIPIARKSEKCCLSAVVLMWSQC